RHRCWRYSSLSAHPPGAKRCRRSRHCQRGRLDTRRALAILDASGPADELIRLSAPARTTWRELKRRPRACDGARSRDLIEDDRRAERCPVVDLLHVPTDLSPTYDRYRVGNIDAAV